MSKAALGKQAQAAAQALDHQDMRASYSHMRVCSVTGRTQECPKGSEDSGLS